MRKKVAYLAIAFICFLCLTIIGRIILKPPALSRVIVLDEGWDVSYNDTEYTDVSLSALRGLIGNATSRGDTIVLRHEIEHMNKYESPTLMFETRFSAWKASFMDISMGQHFFDDYENGKFIGCENNFVTIPPFDFPATLEIELLVAEDGAYSYFEAPVFGSYMDVLIYLIYTNLFVFMTSAFLIIFGLIFFAIAVGFKTNVPEADMQIYSALVFVMLGIWFLTQFRVLDLFIDLHGHQTELEYISLYLVVPLMYMVMGCMQNYLKNWIFLCFFITGTVVSIAPIIIHFAGLRHINQMLTIYQVNALILCVFMIVMLVKDSINGRLKPAQIIQLIGETSLALSFIFNVIFYYLEVAGISKQILLSQKAVPMGTMCMVFATLVNYHIFIAESFARIKEHESLAHLAYADGLTGIPNRSRYEKYLNDMENSKEDYCIISIDLNGLKSVNDNQGHLMGDKYLEEFSRALETAFNNKGFIARIGGDEFVAVLNGNELLSAEELIHELDSMLNNLNEKDHSISRSAATGYAYRHEADTDDWKAVYLLADERMYRKKNDMKLVSGEETR